MSDQDDDGAGLSMDQLAALLRADPSVPRSVRRAALSDARRFAELVEAGGAAPGAVRFRALRCTCCGVVEVSGELPPGARVRMH